VRGWNPAKKQLISSTATRADLPENKSGKTGPEVAQKDFGDKEAIVEASVVSEEEAHQLAISLLRDRAYEFITGEGQMIGLPNLRPGHNVQVNNVGKLFSGPYYVKACDHVIGEHGYTTSFKVRKYFTGDAT
jgi:phage protein D